MKPLQGKGKHPKEGEMNKKRCSISSKEKNGLMYMRT